MIAYALRMILTTLWEFHGAPKLDKEVPRYGRVAPRNVTATREELKAIMEKAGPSLKLWLLLCSDLAVRSGTAHRLSGNNYDPTNGTLRFTTKHHNAQTLPVTDEVRQILAPLDHNSPTPYVWQLRATEPQAAQHPATQFTRHALDRDFRKTRARAGVNRRITPHDLRRTTAVALYEATGDVRTVKALLGHSDLKNTFWYLDHDNTPIPQGTLELIKRPNWKNERTA